MFRSDHIRTRLFRFLSAALLTALSFAPGGSAYADRLSGFTADSVHIMTFSGSDAIILESNGLFGMVDSGEDDDYPDGSDLRYPLRPGVTQGWGYEDEVIAYMHELGVTPGNFLFYIGTHPHSDHIGSADEVIREFHPKRVYIPEYEDEYIANPAALWDNLYVYDRMLEAAYEVGATIIWELDPAAPIEPKLPEADENGQIMLEFGDPLGSHEGREVEDGPTPQHDPASSDGGGQSGFQECSEPDIGQREGRAVEGAIGRPGFMLGDLRIDIVNYDPSYKTERSGDANWFSWGVKVSTSDKSVFLSGDIGNYDGDEDRLAKDLGSVEVLKMGHHGLKTSSTPEFLKALAPDYAVQTGSYSLIPLDRIEALDAIGTRLYCAESSAARGCKAFTVSFSGKHVEVDAPANVVMLEDRADGPRRTAYLNGRKVSLNGWLFDNVGWSWSESSPYAIAGSWLNLNGTWYLFDEAGRMATGWKKKNGVWYLFDSSGAMLRGWQRQNGTWYYLTPSGAMATGWLYLNGSWYWFDPGSGSMMTGWVHDGSAWYFMEPDGHLGSFGWRLLGGIWYYFDDGGAMHTGWLLDRGAWYWLNPQSGAMATGWALDGERWYSFDGSGRMRSGGWLYDGGFWYWLEASGAMRTGWIHDGSAWYYLGTSGRMKSNEWLILDDCQYWLDVSGAMHSGWLYNGDAWYWLDPVSGSKKTGWLRTAGKTYWLNLETGKMATGEVEIDGLLYQFKLTGELA